ncbi:MAG: NYN domain-containing protein [Planctomycetota bacterium]|nr:NYN domain-containing protein [Planctomycetota bacterium]
MPYKTAVFWDIENLIRGYAITNTELSSLSLPAILDDIRESGLVSEICHQRAYANWSNQRLGALRADIIESGIIPVQMFSFSNSNKKNAADIQLAVDVIDVANRSNVFDCFVIVSGDGGFSSVVNRLHEYGKKVVVCAYPNCINDTLKAVSDEFIEVEEPFDTPTLNLSAETQITTPGVLQMREEVTLEDSTETEDLLCKLHETLDWFESDDETIDQLSSVYGLSLSIIGEAFRSVIPNF